MRCAEASLVDFLSTSSTPLTSSWLSLPSLLSRDTHEGAEAPSLQQRRLTPLSSTCSFATRETPKCRHPG